MSVICVIPARGGSQRIPLKNIKEFHGKPIIAYSIIAAMRSQLFDRIVVSTDDDLIADTLMVSCYPVEVWKRDPAFAEDSVGTQDVVAECLLGIGASQNDEVCCIYATAPLMAVRDLAEGFGTLVGPRYGVTDYVMSVGYPPLQDAGQFYWGHAFCFMEGAPLISSRTRMVLIDPWRVCDINTPEDWDRAVKMYTGLNK